jgi:UDP-GlcNAc:undecaprenyl-phosphate GlcNAc-1-phosphate transferase
MIEQQLIAALVALALAVVLGLALRPVVLQFGWVDHPDWRKQHAGDIPLAGGPAIFLAVLAVLAWQDGWSASMHVLAWSSAIIFFTGLVDDRMHVPVPLRFALQIAALLCMVWVGGVQLYNFGFLLWERWLGRSRFLQRWG